MNTSHPSDLPKIPVAHLVITLDNGGLEHLIMRLATYRNKLGEGSTHIICLDQPGALGAGFQGSPVHCLNSDRSKFPWDRQAVNQLCKLLRDLNIKIVHSHNQTANLYAALATHKTKTPHIHTEHGMNLDNHGFKSFLRNRILRFLAPQYVAVSKEVAKNIQETYGIPFDKIHFVANGVEEHQVTSNEKLKLLHQKLNIPHQAYVLGYVGRLAKIKGFDLFLPIFAQLAKDNAYKKPIYLLLVGDGPERGNLQETVKDLCIEKNVCFAGYQKDCRPYYDLTSLFVMPSRSEGLSVSLLEAMNAGCPVAVTAVGEHANLIETSEGGILLKPEAPESWLRGLQDFINNTHKQQICASRGQTHVETNYTLKNTYQSYEVLYQHLLK